MSDSSALNPLASRSIGIIASNQPASTDSRTSPTPEELLEEAKNWPEVDKTQFAMRLLPTHVSGTAYDRSWLEVSLRYWIDWLNLWCEGKCHLIPSTISTEVLNELNQVLKELEEEVALIHSKGDLEEKAIQLLQKIRSSIKTKGYAYVPLQYRPGPCNAGHAIMLRIDPDRHHKKLHLHFLNLGEGVHRHAQLEWDENYPRYHFRSFPVVFSEENFFGKVGVQLFAKQMTLANEPASGNSLGYSAYDVCTPFYLFGEVEKPFISDPTKRSRKPQKGPTCSETAIELTTCDFFIEKGIDPSSIGRFLCNADLCSVMRFFHSAKGVNTKEGWAMLKKGGQEMALTLSKKMKFGLEVEAKRYCVVLECVIDTALAGEKSVPTAQVSPLKITDLNAASPYTLCEKGNLALELMDSPFYFLRNELASISSPPLKIPAASQFLSWIDSVEKYVIAIAQI
jgi:hypothetical protein